MAYLADFSRFAPEETSSPRRRFFWNPEARGGV
jgi:hypothetical protein